MMIIFIVASNRTTHKLNAGAYRLTTSKAIAKQYLGKGKRRKSLRGLSNSLASDLVFSAAGVLCFSIIIIIVNNNLFDRYQNGTQMAQNFVKCNVMFQEGATMRQYFRKNL